MVVSSAKVERMRSWFDLDMVFYVCFVSGKLCSADQSESGPRIWKLSFDVGCILCSLGINNRGRQRGEITNGKYGRPVVVVVVVVFIIVAVDTFKWVFGDVLTAL